MKVSLGMLFLCAVVIQLLCVDAFRRRRRRRRRSPPVVNCVWSNWQAWSACSVTCGNGGTQTRRRSVLTAASGGGSCSGSATCSRSCSGQAIVNCSWNTWQGWSPCSVSCGSGGAQTRVRTKARSEFCGGSACTGISHQQRSCSGYSPVDCAWGDWHEWTACSVTCGSGGTQTRTRCVETSEYCGGTTCSEPSEQQRSCSGYSPVNCTWGDWQEWTACSVTCGSGGTQTRTRCVETSEFCGGAVCSGPKNQQINCSGESINCVWGEWQEWTSCSVTCGNGTQTRIRIAMTPESCGGMTCNGSSEQQKTCENQSSCVCLQGCMRGTASSGSCVDCPFPYTGSCCEQLIDDNPCTAHIDVNQPWRSINYFADAEHLICYTELMDYWYRFTGAGGGEIPTECVKTGRCGVLKPIWLFGNHPSPQEGIVTRKVCTSESTDGDDNCCTDTRTINIKNCNGYYVYKLFQPPNCNEGFCAGKEVPCSQGKHSSNGYTPNCMHNPPANSLSPTLEFIQTSLGDIEFICRFNVQHYNNMSYTVKWYAEGDKQNSFVFSAVHGNSVTLGTQQLRNVFGSSSTTITCTLAAEYINTDGTVMSEPSVVSKSNAVTMNVPSNDSKK